MLRIILGRDAKDEAIRDVSDYFDFEYSEDWLDNDIARQIIKDIDKSDYIKGNYIESPVLGGISPRQLSSGCKALLIMLNDPTQMICGERLGENCFPWVFRLAKDRDITITLHHIPRIDGEFLAHIENIDKDINSRTELFYAFRETKKKGAYVPDA